MNIDNVANVSIFVVQENCCFSLNFQKAYFRLCKNRHVRLASIDSSCYILLNMLHFVGIGEIRYQSAKIGSVSYRRIHTL